VKQDAVPTGRRRWDHAVQRRSRWSWRLLVWGWLGMPARRLGRKEPWMPGPLRAVRGALPRKSPAWPVWIRTGLTVA